MHPTCTTSTKSKKDVSNQACCIFSNNKKYNNPSRDFLTVSIFYDTRASFNQIEVGMFRKVNLFRLKFEQRRCWWSLSFVCGSTEQILFAVNPHFLETRLWVACNWLSAAPRGWCERRTALCIVDGRGILWAWHKDEFLLSPWTGCYLIVIWEEQLMHFTTHLIKRENTIDHSFCKTFQISHFLFVLQQSYHWTSVFSR